MNGDIIFQGIDTATVANNSVKIQKPTLAQLRYWQRLKENKLLVGGKRYIEPKTEVNLVTSIVPATGIGLPMHERNTYNTDWLTLILLVALVLFASVRASYSKYLNNLFLSVINNATSTRMFEEKSYSIINGAGRLEILFYLIFSVFLFQAASYVNLELPFQNRILYIAILGCALIYFMIKKIAYRTIGNIIERTEETGEYLFNHDNFNRVTGLILFPIVTLAAFGPLKNSGALVLSGLIVCSISYFLLLGRGISILLKKQFSIFYLFLYLCSLEFLPLLLISKIVVA